MFNEAVVQYHFEQELEKIAFLWEAGIGAGAGAAAAGKGRREKGAGRGALGGIAGGLTTGVPVALLARNLPATMLASGLGAGIGGVLAGRTARKKKLSKKDREEILAAARVINEKTKKVGKEKGAGVKETAQTAAAIPAALRRVFRESAEGGNPIDRRQSRRPCPTFLDATAHLENRQRRLRLSGRWTESGLYEKFGCYRAGARTPGPGKAGRKKL